MLSEQPEPLSVFCLQSPGWKQDEDRTGTLPRSVSPRVEYTVSEQLAAGRSELGDDLDADRLELAHRGQPVGD